MGPDGVCVLDMQTQLNECLLNLAVGQLWRLEHGYLQIVDLGKRLIYYKMLRTPTQRAAITQMIGMEALLRFLRQNEAELIA
jgi:hypothetical protein